MGWFFGPLALPAGFALSAMLAGLVGGWMLVKCVKVHKAEPVEPLRPLVLGELFEWDRRAFAITLAPVVVVIALLAGLLFQKGIEMPPVLVLFFVITAVLLPAFFLAVRTTTGKVREFFRSMLVLTILSSVGPQGAGFIIRLVEGSGANPTHLLLGLANSLIGIAAGCALIYFGKIRPKAR